MPPPLYIKFCLQTSINLGVIFLVLHFGAAVAICLVSMIVWLKVGLLSYIFVSFVIIIKTYVWLNSNGSVIGIGFSEQHKWWLKRYPDLLVSAELSYPLFISSYLLIVNFILIPSQIKIVVPIFKDGLTIDDFRKIKKLLKFSK